ncbi:hypothetical protein B6E66_13800 [Streptomyces maremycinicus]|nr:hypothetical protein B6E66_13800 [Streptomyces sp. B9173]
MITAHHLVSMKPAWSADYAIYVIGFWVTAALHAVLLLLFIVIVAVCAEWVRQRRRRRRNRPAKACGSWGAPIETDHSAAAPLSGQSDIPGREGSAR